MDELPELLVETVGGDSVEATVDLGGGDWVAVTPARTHLYRSEGLLADESVETYDHDIDRFTTDAGRRKTTLLLQNIDDEERFTVPSSVTDDVVGAMLEGILRTAGVIDDDETVESLFRFSELTLVVTGRQLLKHVGSAVWNDEFEAYHYGDLTGLDFEEGSVATQVVLGTGGRQQRVKVPNDNAGRVRQAVQRSIFEYHDVSSLGGLRAAVGEDERDDASDDAATTEAGGAAQAGAGSDKAGGDGVESADRDDGFVSPDWSPPADQDITRTDDRTSGSDTAEAATPSADVKESSVGAGAENSTAGVGPRTGTGTAAADARSGGTADPSADVETLAERVDDLARRVDHQTALIESQQETIEQLVEELRRGR